MGFGVKGYEFMALDLGFWVRGLEFGFRVWGLGLGVYDLAFGV